MKKLFHALLVALALLGGTQARAGIPVIDGANLVNSIQQVLAWAQQLEQMRSQVTQMRDQFHALNGLRDIGGLLNNELLNQYIPRDYVSAMNQLRSGQGSLSSISGALDDIVKANQLQDCSQTALSQAARDRCKRDWQNLAMNKKIGDLGYQQASKNIDQLQQFITSIKSSPDPKSLQDLAARINVEQVRIQNEQIKLATIQMMDEADRQMRARATSDAFSKTFNAGGTTQIQF